MYELITEETIINSGDTIRKPKGDGGFISITIGSRIILDERPDEICFQVFFESIGNTEWYGFGFTYCKSDMISQRCEIQTSN